MEKMRILAVDDNIVNLATLEQELKDKYEVIPMSSGRRAIKFLYQEKVDLILLDIQMPVMDGIETLREIRTQENGITVPVIFLTAKKDKGTVIEGLKLGIMDYIIKPFNSEDLHTRIERALKRRGALPMGHEELYQRVSEIIDHIHNEKVTPAIVKSEEILGYQIEESISSRIQAAKAKLKLNDLEAAERIVTRTLMMIKKTLDEEERSDLMRISIGELNSRLLFIIEDITNFETEEAATKLEDLMNYSLPIQVYEGVVKAQKALKEFDDGKAEMALKEALKEL